MKLPNFINNFDSEKSKTLAKKHAPGIIANIFRYIFFLSLSYVLIYPFLFMILNAIMGVADSYDATVTWIPKEPTLAHFANAWIVFDISNTF